jgi:hypothetical protein
MVAAYVTFLILKKALPSAWITALAKNHRANPAKADFISRWGNRFEGRCVDVQIRGCADDLISTRLDG